MDYKADYRKIYKLARFCIADDEQFFRLARRKLTVYKVLSTIYFLSILLYGVHTRYIVETECDYIIWFSFVFGLGFLGYLGCIVIINSVRSEDYKYWKEKCAYEREVNIRRYNIAKLKEQLDENREKSQLVNKYET